MSTPDEARAGSVQWIEDQTEEPHWLASIMLRTAYLVGLAAPEHVRTMVSTIIAAEATYAAAVAAGAKADELRSVGSALVKAWGYLAWNCERAGGLEEDNP